LDTEREFGAGDDEEEKEEAPGGRGRKIEEATW
jgi:hypothetical protein